ncbi:MAG TPA: GNAT family protein [Anaerolineaceae bacterium]|nr:GNAT family protein [Anaerolineaceae bacterium]
MIYSTRLRLRAPERSDLPRFVTWVNDPEVTAGLLLYLPMSLEDETSWFESMQKRPPAERPMVIEIREGEGWLPVGNCSFFNLDSRIRSSEVGIMIGEKSFWNQGYGTEAMALLLRHGFETLNLNRIYLRVFANNPRAIRSYEKIGFVHEGVERQGEYKAGQYIDVLLMSVLRSEYEGRRK